MSERLGTIQNQLDRTLGFFGRIEQKSSLVFASNIGLLAISMINLDYGDISVWYVSAPLFLALVIIASSFSTLYMAAYPSLSGGSGSLFYFNEIGRMTERRYVDQFLAASEEDLENDLLGQIWRNSQILREKYAFVKRAFQLTLISMLPLIIFLFSSSYLHSRVVRVG